MRLIPSAILVVATVAGAGAARAQEGSLSSIPLDTERVARRLEHTSRWSYAAADTVGDGQSVIGGELGWPDVTLGFLYGVSKNVDVGAKLELAYGLEGTTSIHFGFGLRVPIRVNFVKKDKLSVLAHFDPGVKIYTGTLDKDFNQATGSYFDKMFFGITFPVGLAVAFSPTREWSIGLGVDVNLGLGVAGVGALSFGISPMAGPEIEYRIDDQIVIGLNTRFGAGIAITSDTQYPEIGRYIPGDTITKFAFKTQLVLGYKM
ncbi:MAG TPA: hypothetical protein VKE22_12550 [Haliangiales bacterium]|nr:hypothetical protein [Haliangiales bacterium]